MLAFLEYSILSNIYGYLIDDGLGDSPNGEMGCFARLINKSLVVCQSD